MQKAKKSKEVPCLTKIGADEHAGVPANKNTFLRADKFDTRVPLGRIKGTPDGQIYTGKYYMSHCKPIGVVDPFDNQSLRAH